MSKALRTFTEDLLTRAGSALSELLAHPITFKQGQIGGFEKSSFTPFGEEFIACLTAMVTEPHEGTIFIGFDLKRVVILGALLEMVPPDGIAERLVEPKFDEDNADAFEEVGNILIGKLDEAIRDDLGVAKIHTKKGETLSGPPAEVYGQIHAQGDYYCLDATIEIEGQEGGPVCFLLHPSLVEEGFKADPEVTRWRIATKVAHEETEPAGSKVNQAVKSSEGDAAADSGIAAAVDGAEGQPAGGGIATAVAGDEEPDGEGHIATAVTPPPETEGETEAGTARPDPSTTPAQSSGAPPAPGSSPRPAPRDRGGLIASAGGPERPILLVVDDDITTRAVLRTWLDGGELLVYEAVSWREASLFLRHHRTDAILLDLYLHDLNGIEACRRLHLHPTTRDVPVILCASHPSREAVLQGLKAGASDFLIKPFDRQRLMEKLDGVLLAAA